MSCPNCGGSGLVKLWQHGAYGPYSLPPPPGSDWNGKLIEAECLTCNPLLNLPEEPGDEAQAA